MVCTSIRPLLGWQLDEQNITQTELAEQVQALQVENRKLLRINAALIERVESGAAQHSESYTAFRHSVVLAEQVRERTDALNQVMADLKRSNILLSDARHKAEVAHQHLIDAIESISEGFVLFDKAQRIVLFNHHFKRFWDQSTHRVGVGTSLFEVKTFLENTGLVVEKLRAGQQGMLYRLRTGRWLQVTERPTQEGGLVILYTDITELKHSETQRREQALAQKTRLLQQTVDNLSQGVVMVNAKGVLELWNHRFLEICALQPFEPNCLYHEVMRDNADMLLTPSTVDENGQPRLQKEQRMADGRVIEIRAHPLPNGDFVNTFTDITERYLHAEVLRKREEWIRLITDHVPAMIAYVNSDFTYEFTNKVYEQWYRWPRDSILGQSLCEAHSDEHFLRLQPYINRALQGESLTFEVAEHSVLGRKRFMQRSYVPNRQSNGEISGIFVLVRDITERRQTAEALHQAYQNLEGRVRERTAELTMLNNQLISEIDVRKQTEAHLLEAKREAEEANLSKTKFLAAVSHDLLQPLNAARLFAGSLADSPNPSNCSSLIKNISNALDDVETLLGTLVDISKLDAGVIKADTSVFAVQNLLENLALEYQQVAQSVGLQLNFVASSVFVRSDIHLLARVLRNFLSNAIRYTPSGRIVLGCRRYLGYVSIQVWDTGIGIEKEKQGEIFQEFKRGNRQGHKQDRGLGLGLAIVDKITRILGHRVRVVSQAGQGSMFSVEVPLVGADQLPKPSLHELPVYHLDRLRGVRVWVLDNDMAICVAMRTLLESWGCLVTTGVSEEDLAEQVGGFDTDVDLLIADYHLDNGVNGVDAVINIQRHREQLIPTMMITANYSNELKQQMRAAGHTLLHKPVKPMQLKVVMNHLLERAGVGGSA
ncbi:NahK/ErcS family hybrid sensor histidine kinase/response regulator [Denitrificimonas sp. JX-1]|uniref:histidine kinase n=1 Tax=Denitrificimonas halotolerans TaxID=3098930 RepID=A0ABU5GTL3_9GAMM|nr:NahK/ErcS family hybrid sensor histidine kinase/response regulator [Denitrificimonas sp. JX-1]MDY7220325.1 NahK/ErcS family hybrid sensor histidine kinase/response regulator [Denitrificimonas sp. JX-1]